MSPDSDRRTRSAVLVVDQDVELCDAMTARLSTTPGYEVRHERSAQAALDAAADGSADLLVLSIDLPGEDALDLLQRVRETDRELPVIIMSGIENAAVAAQCVQRGAYAYVAKPVDPNELVNLVEQGLRSRDDVRSETIAHLRRNFERTITGTLEIVMSLGEAKDPALVGHSQRVAALAATVADQMKMSDEEVEEVRLAGRFHDIGKIGIPDALLHRRDSHTPEELLLVRRHAALGAEILAGIEHLGRVADCVRSHHEHWDGSGYPDGLSGEEIPLGARILCAVEVFDALTTAGTDRPALNSIDAVRRMMGLEGKVIDPDVLTALADVVADQRNLPFMVEPDQRLNASGIVMLSDAGM